MINEANVGKWDSFTKLFVYGRFKHGKDRRLFLEDLKGVEAAVWGQLYLNPDKFPILQVPEDQILLTVKGNPIHDVPLARPFNKSCRRFGRLGKPWFKVQGELITITTAFETLLRLDCKMNCILGEVIEHRRVLLPVQMKQRSRVAPAWCYVLPNHDPVDYPQIESWPLSQCDRWKK